ncbi:AAA family ATPase [Streptomyces sp. NPDC048331]|uniref:AAA family ATPase n=1 Tax=Streptomyces sp. NPDC048331 TaxID=3365534 RepID=UPI0037248E1F
MTLISPAIVGDGPYLVVLLGAAGAGKSALASTWPATQVLELDHFRALVSDDAGDQEATADAVTALHCVLEARLARKLTTVIDATHTDAPVRARLVDTARRHGATPIALLVATPLSVCLERNRRRPENGRVPEDVVRAQHAAIVAAHPYLHDEGFEHVVFSEHVYRLGTLLARVSETRRAELGLDGSDGLGDELLLRRFFGPELARLAVWLPGSMVAGGDRVCELRLGADRLTLAFRQDVDGEGDFGFDVLLSCPEGCPAPAWAPVYNAGDLYKAYCGDLDDDEDLTCTHCGPRPGSDLDDLLAEAV